REVAAATQEQLTELARLLGIERAALDVKLGATQGFQYLQRQLDPATARQIAALDIAGVGMRREWRRAYPYGEVMGHIVGFTNIDHIGQEGMELAHQDSLEATSGSRRVIKDRLGHLAQDLGR